MARLEYTAEGYPFYADDGDAAPGDGTQLERVLPVVAPDDDAFTVAARKLYRGVRSEAREGRGGKLLDLLAGGNPEVERYQMWPEKMVRSAVTLPYDAMMGRVPETEAVMEPNALASFLGADPKATWLVPASESMIGRVQDLAGLAIGGPLTAPRGGVTLRSGLERPDIGGGAVKAPTVAEATAHAKESVAATGGRWESYTPEQQQEWLRQSYDQIVKQRERELFANPAPVFYSAVEHAVNNARQQSAMPDQWLGFLRNQPSVKAEELQWMGLNDWLRSQKGPVRREQIDEFVKNNKVEIKTIEKKWEEDPGPPSEQWIQEVTSDLMQDQSRQFREEHGRRATEAEYNRLYKEIYDDIKENPYEYSWAEEGGGVGGATKYSEYQLPGGENYRELLLTLPERKESQYFVRHTPGRTFPYDIVDRSTGQSVSTGSNKIEGMGPFTEGHYAEKALGKINQPTQNYQTSHWDEPNVLAHVRVNDRVMGAKVEPFTAVEKVELDKLSRMDLEQRRAAGKQERYEDLLDREDRSVGGEGLGTEIGKRASGGARTLFLEEVQSDWHQAGRKGGYKGNQAQLKKQYEEALAEANKYAPHSPEYEAGYARAQKLATELTDSQRVPDAPFKTTWPDLVLKRMVREAAENGYDQIAWTTGEVQAARYDLSKHIDKLEYNPDTGSLIGRKGGATPLMQSGVTPDKLEQFVGKDVAKKLTEQKARDVVEDYGLHVKEIGPGNFQLVDSYNNHPNFLPRQGWETRVEAQNQLDKHLRTQRELAGYRELSGLDLKVGGEGMKAFYDKMLVDKANALGKKFGAKVERQALSDSPDIRRSIEIRDRIKKLEAEQDKAPLALRDTHEVIKEDGKYHVVPKDNRQQRLGRFHEGYDTPEAAIAGVSQSVSSHFFPQIFEPSKRWAEAAKEIAKLRQDGLKLYDRHGIGDAELEQAALPVWVMKITPKMREAAIGKGFPLFSAGLPFQFERVDHDPFATQYQSPLFRTEPVDHDPFGVLPYDPNRT